MPMRRSRASFFISNSVFISVSIYAAQIGDNRPIEGLFVDFWGIRADVKVLFLYIGNLSLNIGRFFISGRIINSSA